MRVSIVPNTSAGSAKTCKKSAIHGNWMLALLLLLVAHGACAQGYLFKSEFGISGSGDGQFIEPNFAFVDPANQNIVVVDSGNGRLQRFTSTGSYLSKVVLPDSANYLIELSAFDPISRNLLTSGFFSAGTFGSGYYQIYSLAGASLNATEDAHLTDAVGFAIEPATHNLLASNYPDQVQILTTTNGVSFVYASGFGGPGEGNGQFNKVGGLTIDATNHHVAVADGGTHHRVQFFTTGGVYLSQVATASTIAPIGLAIDPASQVFVVTYSTPDATTALRMYSYAGKDLGQIVHLGTGSGELGTAAGIFIDPISHELLVADFANYKVMMFNFVADDIFHDRME